MSEPLIKKQTVYDLKYREGFYGTEAYWEPLHDRFIFTEDELRQLLTTTYNRGSNDGFRMAKKREVSDPAQFIQSLLSGK